MKIKIIACFIASVIMMSLIPQYVSAHGASGVADCTMSNIEYNTFLYREDVGSINEAANLYVEAHPHAAMKELTEYMRNLYVYLNQPVEIIQCLRHLEVNPDHIAKLSPLAYSVLSRDKQELGGFSPGFLKEMPAKTTSNNYD